MIPCLAGSVRFVFGSNLAGRHGAGAALVAFADWGAEFGVGVGPTGLCYALPTKDRTLRVLPLKVIERYVQQFLEYATANPHLTFFVSRIGCGLAGFTDEQIAPLFRHAPPNCTLPVPWQALLQSPEVL